MVRSLAKCDYSIVKFFSQWKKPPKWCSEVYFWSDYFIGKMISQFSNRSLGRSPRWRFRVFWRPMHSTRGTLATDPAAKRRRQWQLFRVMIRRSTLVMEAQRNLCGLWRRIMKVSLLPGFRYKFWMAKETQHNKIVHFNMSKSEKIG